MARNIYKSAMSVGLTSGKMRASMYDMASFENQKKLEDIELSLDTEKLNRNVGYISDAISLAATVAGRYGDISEDVSTIESKYGEMEQPESMFGKVIQSAKIGLGVGEYKFGEETIAAKDFALTSAKLTQQNMFDEALSNLTKDENINDSDLYKYIDPRVFNPPKATAKDIQKQRDQIKRASELQLDSEFENLNLDSLFEKNYEDYEGM